MLSTYYCLDKIKKSLEQFWSPLITRFPPVKLITADELVIVPKEIVDAVVGSTSVELPDTG